MSAMRDSVAGPNCVGLGGHPLEFVVGAVEQALGDRVRHLLQHDQVAQAFEQVAGEAAGIVAGLGDPIDRRVDGRAVTGGQRVADLVDQRDIGDAEQGDRARVGHALRPGAGDELVEHRQRVTGGAAAGADDQREDGRLDRDALGRAELLEIGPQHAGRDEPERVVMRTRLDRAEHLLRLGRREHELHVFRRLLDELEQRVEAGRRDHVGLVDDVDLEAARDRREERALAQVTGVVDATVAGRVDLDDVDRAGAVGGERAARLALAARIGRRALLAVERAGQDAGAAGLAAAAGAGEQVGVVEPAGAQRLAERLGDVLLADDLGERARPVFAVERQRHVALLPPLREAADEPSVAQHL